MHGKRVFLTGAEGEIGQRLLEALASRGVAVHAFDGDVALEAARGEVVAFSPSVVVHLAESKSGDPRVNILGTINMLHAAKIAGAERFVFGSAVGAADPASPYDVSKLAGERYCESYRAVHGLPFVALRLPEEGSEDAAVRGLLDAITL